MEIYQHTRRDALSAIRYQLDEIHASIKGLNPEKFVPVPGAIHAEPVEYETLLMMERDGDEFYKVRDGTRLISFNISQLLNGVESEYERRQNVHLHIGGDMKGNIIVGNENKIGHVEENNDETNFS